MNALERLLEQVESLRPTGEIGDGKVAHLHALAATVRRERADVAAMVAHAKAPSDYTVVPRPEGQAVANIAERTQPSRAYDFEPVGLELFVLPQPPEHVDCERRCVEPPPFALTSRGCLAERQGDERYCARHGTRWGVDEEAPTSCA